VALTVTNTTGSDTETKTDLVHVYNSTPDADFTYNATEGYPYVTVQFMDNSSGNNITQWSWVFGDGSVSSDQNPIHNYTEEGIYSVSLTVTNDGGSNQETKPNLITVENPLAPFAPDEDSNSLLLGSDARLYPVQRVVTSTYEQGIRLMQVVFISIVAAGAFFMLRRNGMMPSVMGNAHEINVTEVVAVMLVFLVLGFLGLMIVGV